MGSLGSPFDDATNQQLREAKAAREAAEKEVARIREQAELEQKNLRTWELEEKRKADERRKKNMVEKAVRDEQPEELVLK